MNECARKTSVHVNGNGGKPADAHGVPSQGRNPESFRRHYECGPEYGTRQRCDFEIDKRYGGERRAPHVRHEEGVDGQCLRGIEGFLREVGG